MNIQQKLNQLIKSITPQTKLAVLHDTDPDGVCSAAVLSKAIEKLRNKPIDLRINKQHGQILINENMLSDLRKNKIDLLFTCDLTLDQSPESIEVVSKFCKIVIFDHHTIYNKLENLENALLIKAQFINKKIDGSKYPTSKLVYDLFSKHINLEDLDWLACAGLIADMGYKTWKSFVDKVMKKYKIKKQKNIFDTKLGLVSSYISSFDNYGAKDFDSLFNIIYNAKKIDDVLSSKLKTYYEAVEKELNKWLDSFENNKEEYKNLNLVFYEIKPRYSIGSPVSTILSLKNKNKTLILIMDTGDKYLKISLRCQSGKVNVADLAVQATQGLPDATGGGHKPASGARIRKQDLELFKQNILNYIKQNQ